MSNNKLILRDLKEKLLEERKEYDTSELIVARIMYKNHITGGPYRITRRHIFKQIRSGQITLYQLISNGLIYRGIDKTSFFGYTVPFVVEKTSFKEIFGVKKTITHNKLLKLSEYLINEDLQEETSKKLAKLQ